MSTRYPIQLAHQCLAAMVSLKVGKDRAMVVGDDSFRAPNAQSLRHYWVGWGSRDLWVLLTPPPHEAGPVNPSRGIR
jgi:hypothetical protein